MKKSEAENHERFIADYCRKHGIWFDTDKKHRPKLGMIEMNIAIKVDSDD